MNRAELYDKQLDEFVKCINEQRYYDAHEALEIIWFERRFEKSNEVKLLKGFINSAVSFELRRKGKEAQAKKVWLNYLKYRQLLYKTDSPFLNKYHFIARNIEKININFNKPITLL